MHPPSKTFRWGSADRAPAPPLRLQAGPLVMRFEPQTGFLRRIRLGATEVLRGLYAAVRDRNWGTVPPAISHLQSQIEEASFQVTFDARCQEGPIDFVWHGKLTGAADGTVTFTFDGQAGSTFLKNRIGFCVLHPIRECAGAPARYERTDGSLVERRFPECIEPQLFGQAGFCDLRRLAHEVQRGLWAELRFEGEVFEMEDQRNWTDASFKTYCTPLALPFPVEVKAGTRIRQSVTLRLAGVNEQLWSPRRKERAEKTQNGSAVISFLRGGSERDAPTVLVVPSRPTVSLPQLGLGLASHGQPLTSLEIERLRALRLAHLRADLRLAENGWNEILARAAREAQAIGAALELAIHLPAQDGGRALTELRGRLEAAPVRIARMVVLRQGEPATSAVTLHAARAILGRLGAPLGGGTDAHFCELNREQALGRLGLAEADFVSWPMTPQVHVGDNLSVVETLEAQPHTVTSARAFAGKRPLVVSPITLKPRFNAVAVGNEPARAAHELPPPVDPRQMSLFAAAWTLGSIAALAEAGAESATFFETTGWRGLMEVEMGSPLPNRFLSMPGTVFPVFHLFAAMADFRQAAPVPAERSDTVAALCLFTNCRRCRLLLADLTGNGGIVTLRVQAPATRVRLLDETTAEQALREPERFLSWKGKRLDCLSGSVKLVLKPHALANLDF